MTKSLQQGLIRYKKNLKIDRSKHIKCGDKIHFYKHATFEIRHPGISLRVFIESDLILNARLSK